MPESDSPVVGTGYWKPMTDPPFTPNSDALLGPTARLRRLAAELVTDAAAADDLVQDAWVAWLQRTSSPENPAGWFAGTLRNLAKQRHRARARRVLRERASARPEAQPDTAELFERAQLHGALVQAVTELREPYRSTLLLRYLEDLPPRAIAKRLRVPLNTVNTRLARGLAELRAQLDHRPGGRERWMSAFAAWGLPPTKTLVSLGGLTMTAVPKIAAAAVATLAIGFGGWWLLEREPVAEPDSIELGQASPVSLGLELPEPRAQAEQGATRQAHRAPESEAALAPTSAATLVLQTISSLTGDSLAGVISLKTEDLLNDPGSKRAVWQGEPTDTNGVREVLVRSGRAIEVVANGGLAMGIGQVKQTIPVLAPGERREVRLILPEGLDRTWFGQVLGAEDGRPIAGASIELVDQRGWAKTEGDPLAQTSSRLGGLFELALPSWKATVAKVQAPGRAPALVAPVFDHDRPGAEQSVRLQVAATLEVAVDAAGRYLEGARVRVQAEAFRWLGGDAQGTRPFAWKPDPEWSMPVEGGQVLTFVELPVAVPLRVALVEGDRVLEQIEGPLTLGAGQTSRLAFDISHPGRIGGRVRAADGSPAAGIDLWLMPAGRPNAKLFLASEKSAIAAAIQSDATGAFEFEDVSSGEWWLGPAPWLNGFARLGTPAGKTPPLAQWLQLEAGESKTLDLELAPSLEIRGRALDARGEVLPGAMLVASSPVLGPAETYFAGQDGSFVIRPLAPGTYRIFALYGGARSSSVSAEAGATGVEVRFPPGGSIEGRFLGLPQSVVGRVLMFTPAGSGQQLDRELPRASIRMLQYTSENSYRIDRLEPGFYDVSARAGNAWAARRERIEVKPGETTAGLDLNFAPAATLAIEAPKDQPFVRVDAIQGSALVAVDWLEPESSGELTVQPQTTLVIARDPSGAILQRWDLSPGPAERATLEFDE